MSDSLIAFQPAIDEPSNMKPSVSMSSSITPEAMVKCCHLPLGSVKRRSTQSISSSLIRDRMVPGLFAMTVALAQKISSRSSRAMPRAGGRPATTVRFELGTSDSPRREESQGGSEYFTAPLAAAWSGTGSSAEPLSPTGGRLNGDGRHAFHPAVVDRRSDPDHPSAGAL